ncbi:MAG: hypothetical protein KKA73_13145 [Chloroflexi bacterium]|nr:hypothetical protein [Chloroflexota bacterium]MBU1748628.1 hypothetical protein [Chloroflexota bacterium]MBU1880094.1 hypothetical protein [Chloroflexota bacterium]
MILGFKGDIKTSTYFLQAARTRTLPHDFYITRIHGRRRMRTLVVFMREDMWQTIDGETLLVLLEQLAEQGMLERDTTYKRAINFVEELRERREALQASSNSS